MIWEEKDMFSQLSKMKKVLSVGAIAASMAVMLTGCGGSQSASSSSGSGAAQQEISGKISASIEFFVILASKDSIN